MKPRHTSLSRRVVASLLLFGLCIGGACVWAQDQPNRDAILGHLNQVIGWYRGATTNVPPGELPSDVIFQQNVRTLSSQAVQFAFESARAQAALLGESTQAGGETDVGSANYSQVQAQVSKRLADAQSNLDDVNKQMASASGEKRKGLTAQRDALAGQIELDKAILGSIEKMANFVELNAANRQGLEGSINELANSIPEVLPQAGQSKGATKVVPVTTPTASRSGLIGELVTLYDLVQGIREIDSLRAQGAHVLQSASALREPLRTAIRAIVAQGQQTMPAPAPSGPAPAKPPDFKQLTNRYNQLAAALIPLNQEIVVLQQADSNLNQWRSSITSESRRDLIALLFRVFGIAFALAVIWGLSELWRRLTFRYVHDARRRRQFLTLRRFVMGFCFGMVVILGFVSEFGSLATYAGFVTAGIAVALQTLLLSVAAYFFVVGRYGIRVGDRISVAGVTGDVVDVGLVRIYLMELASSGVDLHPTGRIAVFSNSVLFQPTTPLFKQVPGTEYAWHELVITVKPEGDHRALRDKALAAVNSVYGEYRSEFERQQGEIGDRLEIVLTAPAPDSRFQLDDAGLALIVRYPVLLSRAEEIDDRITQTAIDILAHEEPAKQTISGTPEIRAVVRG